MGINSAQCSVKNNLLLIPYTTHDIYILQMVKCAEQDAITSDRRNNFSNLLTSQIRVPGRGVREIPGNCIRSSIRRAQCLIIIGIG